MEFFKVLFGFSIAVPLTICFVVVNEEPNNHEATYLCSK